MLSKSKVVLSLVVVSFIVTTIWLFQPKHLRELDTKGPDTTVWECVGAYCTGPGL